MAAVLLFRLASPMITAAAIARPPFAPARMRVMAPGAATRWHASMSGAESKWTAEEVRSQFVTFFEEKEHSGVPSSPVVPYDDPTLLFANAGMNQFKPLFAGQAQPGERAASLKRATNSPGASAGGKHNDLEDVGMDTPPHVLRDARRWSFGDYFKEEAIDWAWELLTKVYGLPRPLLRDLL